MRKGNATARVSDETIAESKRLRELWEKRKTMTQVEFGEKYGIGTQGAMYQFLNGVTPISLKAAIGFAKGLNCQISDFSPRLAAEAMRHAEAVKNETDDSFASIKMLNVEVSAGGGASGVDIVEEIEPMNFRRTFLNSVGVNPLHAAIVTVRGDSMQPTLVDNAVVLINMNDTSPRNGNIYAFVYEGALLIKRFFFDNGAWVARSDNANKNKYKDVKIDPTRQCQILGRALWVGMSL